MRTATAVVIALVLVSLAILTGVVVATEQPTAASTIVETEAGSGQTAAAVGDLGTAAAATNATLQVHHEHRSVAGELSAAGAGDRAAVFEAYLERLDDEFATRLTADHQAAMALEDAAADTSSLSRQLAITGAVANARQAALSDVDMASIPGVDVADELQARAGRLALLSGPVRSTIIAAMADPGRPTTVVMDGHEDGLRLAVVDGDQVHHEGVRFDRYFDGHDTFDGIGDAEAVAAATFPETTSTTLAQSFGDGLYRVDRTHPSGSVSAIVGGVTADVVAASESYQLDALALREAGSTLEHGVDVTIERADAAGVLRVTAVETATGSSVDGTAYIRHGGVWTPIGDLDDAGQAWSAEPGGPIDIRVVTDTGTITLSVTR